MTADFLPRRRSTRRVRIGPASLGDHQPVLVQSMATVPVTRTAEAVAQAQAIAVVGGQLVRFTTPTVADAQALAAIRSGLDSCGLSGLPLCADVHFQAEAALTAIRLVEKVRINPGNYAEPHGGRSADSATPAQARARVAARLAPLLAAARAQGRALRIGVNHGSLSRRMLDAWGDTPAGMVASAREYVEEIQAAGFTDLVVSLKSSNPRIMIQAYRLAARELPDVPLHLGVTEAGSGFEGRIKGAAGIGALLADGIGDTIRVSLTEPPEAEIPVALALARQVMEPPPITLPPGLAWTPWSDRRPSHPLGPGLLGGQAPLAVLAIPGGSGQLAPDLLVGPGGDLRQPSQAEALARLVLLNLDLADPAAGLIRDLSALPPTTLVGLDRLGGLPLLGAYRLLATLAGPRPLCLACPGINDPLLLAGPLANLLLDGVGDALFLPDLPHPVDTAFAILQAVRRRLSRAEIISCPACGRTGFPIEALAEEVKRTCGHLTGLTIAVMGCIVNGPGEMAGADFGCIGDGPGTVALFQGSQPVQRHVPADQAGPALVRLIQQAGRWE